MKSTFFLLAALFAVISAAPLLYERQDVSALPASTDVASLTPSSDSTFADSFALPVGGNSTTPASTTSTGEGNGGLGDLTSGLDASAGDGGNSTVDSSDLLSSFGFSPEDVSAAQAQQGSADTSGLGGLDGLDSSDSTPVDAVATADDSASPTDEEEDPTSGDDAESAYAADATAAA
ncbi:hypothetical protein JCM6882_001114 [Rhodosporidiobolus microsporus]